MTARRFILAAVLSLIGARAQAGLDLQRLIDAAEPGATIRVPAGTYGPIRCDKPITLIGENWPIIDGGGKSDVVIFAGAASRISGFVIRNSGDSLDHESTGLRVVGASSVIENNRFENVLFGIDLKSAPGCVIRGNHIGSMPLDIARRGDALRLFRSDDCLIEANTIEDGRDALLWYSNRVIVRNNTSRRNRYGFHMMYANEVTLEGNTVTDNSVGIYLMYGKKFKVAGNRLLRNRGPSGYGIGLKEVDQYDIRDNDLAANRVAIYIDGSPFTRRAGAASITRNNFACNDIGLALLPAVKGNAIHENNFIDNIEQLAVLGRGAVGGNDFARDGRGNFWSDFGGYDANHDGVGDQPYVSRKLFESLADRQPQLRLFLFSPAHDAIEFVGRAIPAIRPEPKFSDANPLMAPVAVRLAGGDDLNSRRGLLVAAVGMLASAAGIFGIAFASLRNPGGGV